MTVRAKYCYWAIAGLAFWAIVFYAVLYRILGCSSGHALLAYAVLLAILGPGQFAMYKSERIPEYRARLRRRLEITCCMTLALWTAVVLWAFLSSPITWPLASVCWLVGAFVGILALWLGYKTMLKLQLGNQSADAFRK